MGKKSSSELTLCFLLMAALCFEAVIIKRMISYSSIVKDWTEARLHCQRKHIDLVTWNTAGSFRLFERLMQRETQRFWIGLFRDPENESVWKWINQKAGDLPSVYRNWAKSEQLNLDCACFNAATEKCHMTACSTKLHPVCHDDNLVVVNENKTWEEALSYCSEMRALCRNTSEPCYNLLSLNSADYNYVRDRIYRVTTTDEVWTGLRFLGGSWWWADGHKVEDQGKLPGCPSRWQHCGAVSKYNTNNWIVRDCSERKNFICYRHKK